MLKGSKAGKSHLKSLKKYQKLKQKKSQPVLSPFSNHNDTIISTSQLSASISTIPTSHLLQQATTTHSTTTSVQRASITTTPTKQKLRRKLHPQTSPLLTQINAQNALATQEGFVAPLSTLSTPFHTKRPKKIHHLGLPTFSPSPILPQHQLLKNHLIAAQISPISTTSSPVRPHAPSAPSYLRHSNKSSSHLSTSISSPRVSALSPRPQSKLHAKLVEIIPKIQNHINSYSTTIPKRHKQQQQQNHQYTSNSTGSSSQQNHNYAHIHREIPNTAFQRLLPHISRLSATLTPKIKKLFSFMKSGTMKLLNPVIDPAKLAISRVLDVASPKLGKITHKFESLMYWVDSQIAKRENIPKDQIASIRTQVIAIVANSIVALSKATAAYFSNSGVMLAEALHSLADLSNQALLLFGTSKALRDSDDVHPYGYATAKYIYGVLSASGVFFISCALTLYHAIAQYFDDHHIVEVSVLTVAVLGVSAVVEGYSQWTAYKTIKDLAAEEEMTFSEYIKRGSDTSSIAVFVEDSIALVGLGIAIASTVLTHMYQSNIFDTVGTAAIGLAMGFVAYFLFHRNESYVLGTSMTQQDRDDILGALRTRPSVLAVHDLKAVHYGEQDTRVKAEIAFNGTVIAQQVLDESKLVHVSVPFLEDDAPVQAGTIKKHHEQQMVFGPDGTIAGNEILHHLTRFGMSPADAKQLLVRYGSECVQEVARETDQVEQYTREQFPEVTHLDLECHSTSPLDDFTSEHFLYPYLEKFKREKALNVDERTNKRAWATSAKTKMMSLKEAMKGQHHLPLRNEFDHINLQQHTLQPGDALSEINKVTAPPQKPQVETTDSDVDYSHMYGPSGGDKQRNYHHGKYKQPVRAQELIKNQIYEELLSVYQQTHGLPYIDQSMALFPLPGENTDSTQEKDSRWRPTRNATRVINLTQNNIRNIIPDLDDTIVAAVNQDKMDKKM